jgi:prepilin-type N-terminal cleavage/methylation domain-containing protein
MKNNKAFTIIELLIVLSIMATIVGILVLNFQGLNTEARNTKADGDLRVLKIAVETYSIAKNHLPSSLSELEGGPTLATLPKDPYAGGKNYNYYSNGIYFAIWSVGPNGNSGIVAINPGGLVSDSDEDDLGTTNGACPNQFWK